MKLENAWKMQRAINWNFIYENKGNRRKGRLRDIYLHERDIRGKMKEN